MTTIEMHVMRRTRRRTHLIMSGAVGPMCGTRTSITDARSVSVPLNGATAWLKNELIREMDENSCKHCTRIAIAMLALYVSRDTGKAW